MMHGSLFSGIGGFDLAAQWAGIENVFQVEIDKFCQKVLEKNFPNTKKYLDIKEFNGKEYTGKIDIISGGFPCQPFSVAGKQKGSSDERHLFPEMLRVVQEVKPSWVIAENVYGLLNIEGGMVFEQVCAELERLSYEVQTFIIPAAGVNAWHRRDRLWIVAYSDSIRKRAGHRQVQRENEEISERNDNAELSNTDTAENSERIGRKRGMRNGGKISGKNGKGNADTFEGSDKTCGTDTDGNGKGQQGYRKSRTQKQGQCGLLDRERNPQRGDMWERHWTEVATEFCGVADGISNRVDRLKGLGNAIVPQIAYQIFKTIIEIENDKQL